LIPSPIGFFLLAGQTYLGLGRSVSEGGKLEFAMVA